MEDVQILQVQIFYSLIFQVDSQNFHSTAEEHLHDWATRDAATLTRIKTLPYPRKILFPFEKERKIL